MKAEKRLRLYLADMPIVEFRYAYEFIKKLGYDPDLFIRGEDGRGIYWECALEIIEIQIRDNL